MSSRVLIRQCVLITLRGAIAVLAILLSSRAMTAAVGISDDGTGMLRNNFTGTIGYRFTVGSSNLSVTALGFWDDTARDVAGSTAESSGAPDGLSNETGHKIGIWDNLTNLLTSATVPTATGGSLVDEWRYVSLDLPLTLSAGSTYTIGAYVVNGDGDLWHDASNTPLFASDIASEAALSSPGNENDLLDPQFSGGAAAYSVPNFQYSVVPEPTGFTLAFSAAVSLFCVRRRNTAAG